MGFNQTINLLGSNNEPVVVADFLQNGTERITQAYRTITTNHGYIHAGIGFTISNKMDIAANKVGAFSFTGIPANTFVHFQPALITGIGGPIYVSLLEDYTFTGGTLVTPHNHNMNSLITPTLIVKSNVTYTPSTDSFTQVFLGGGTGVGQSRSGWETTVSTKWILVPETDYVFVFTNEGDASETIQINNTWAEI